MSNHRAPSSPVTRRSVLTLVAGTGICLVVAAVVGESRDGHSTPKTSTPPTSTRPTNTEPSPSASPTPTAPPEHVPGTPVSAEELIPDADGVIRIDDHIIVNKSFALPATYEPGGLTPEATAAFEAMRAEAAIGGVSIWIASGYRSYERQQANYTNRVNAVGVEAADRGMARPGHSEHQTGLAMDVNQIATSFGQTTAGRWVAENGQRFGFIIRYPDGKESITGFKYEPWHLRYVGVDFATELTNLGMTIEEYYGLPSAYAS